MLVRSISVQIKAFLVFAKYFNIINVSDIVLSYPKSMEAKLLYKWAGFGIKGKLYIVISKPVIESIIFQFTKTKPSLNKETKTCMQSF